MPKFPAEGPVPGYCLKDSASPDCDLNHLEGVEASRILGPPSFQSEMF